MMASRPLALGLATLLTLSVGRASGQARARIEHMLCGQIKAAAGKTVRALPCKTCGADGRILNRGTGKWLTCPNCIEGFRISRKTMRKALGFIAMLRDAGWPEHKAIPSVEENVKRALKALAMAGATELRGSVMNKKVGALVNKNQAHNTPMVLAGRIFNVVTNNKIDGSLFQMFLDDGMYGSEVVVLVGPQMKIEPEGCRAVVMGTWNRGTMTYLTLGGIRDDPLIDVFWGKVVIDNTKRSWW